MDPIAAIGNLISAHPTVFWTVVVCWLVSAALNAMPKPTEASHWVYVWVYNFGQWTGANMSKLHWPGSAPTPQAPPKS